MSVLEKKKYLEVTYDEAKVPRTQYPFLLAKYLYKSFFRKAGRILDVGCGRGEYLEAFTGLGLQTEGVDISPSTQDLNPHLKIKKCNFEAEALPYKDNSFDFVFSKSVIEHLHHPEHILDECYRILKPGGIAIIMCPSWLHTYWGPFYIDHTHVTPFTLPSLEQALIMSGFNTLHSEHFIQLPLIWRYPGLKILCGLIAALPLPFRPLYKTNISEPINKIIRFSKEKMLLAVASKCEK